MPFFKTFLVLVFFTFELFLDFVDLGLSIELLDVMPLDWMEGSLKKVLTVAI